MRQRDFLRLGALGQDDDSPRGLRKIRAQRRKYEREREAVFEAQQPENQLWTENGILYRGLGYGTEPWLYPGTMFGPQNVMAQMAQAARRIPGFARGWGLPADLADKQQLFTYRNPGFAQKVGKPAVLLAATAIIGGAVYGAITGEVAVAGEVALAESAAWEAAIAESAAIEAAAAEPLLAWEAAGAVLSEAEFAELAAASEAAIAEAAPVAVSPAVASAPISAPVPPPSGGWSLPSATTIAKQAAPLIMKAIAKPSAPVAAVRPPAAPPYPIGFAPGYGSDYRTLTADADNTMLYLGGGLLLAVLAAITLRSNR